LVALRLLWWQHQLVHKRPDILFPELLNAFDFAALALPVAIITSLQSFQVLIV